MTTLLFVGAECGGDAAMARRVNVGVKEGRNAVRESIFCLLWVGNIFCCFCFVLNILLLNKNLPKKRKNREIVQEREDR